MDTLVILVILGAITAAIAAGKGRSIVGWFFGGFFLGILGVILILCMSNLKEEEAKRAREALERRRLREKLKQEQLKNEAFRQHAAERLDAHDNLLGTDTRGANRQLGGGAQQAQLGFGAEDEAQMPQQRPARTGSPAPAPGTFGGVQWYFEINGETVGPAAETAVINMLRSGKIAPSTLVCREDQEQWLPASQVPAFRAIRKT
jgi:hypothetical protein